jgi:hypothetical protein
VVRDGAGIHSVSSRLFEKAIEPDSAIEKAELRVQMEVSEINHVLGRYSIL